ncbi:putative translation initiation factor eIF5 [Mycosarcoma maydis]|uniref:Translation initiation factor eIF5 n=1 Tax=Mycosarcoma maydis TaxID=5270 RepID=A0A0D1DVS8_MYCMD|nr:putative translation initiation factor eIF5 [Ustilago maydis 521]KIS66570.1 putative translation initiation factor eIF5 [Ustilago maydis 521]|eukprot:XP_011391868.1 putative translation initiation factor eIF5 [Ustilago maydis 521]
MSVVNIRRDVDDKFYRYRMPLLQTKIEGKGNGIKTVIPNMSDIARSLSRPPTYPTKFFGCELGAQTSFDEKNDRYIVNGAHDADRLRELLDGFIDKFVLCGDCKNPETDLKILKDGDILRNCKACGKRTGVDMKHKLTTFIVKHPPPKRVKGAKGAGKAAGQDAGDAGSDDELTKRIKAEAAEIPTAEQRGNADDDWSVDTSEAAVAARVKALEGSVKSSLVLGDDDEDEDEDSPYAQFGQWLQANRKGGQEGRECTPAEVYKKAQEFGIEKKHKTVQVLAQALFTEDAPKEIEKYGAVLVKMVGDSEKHQKAMLGGFERLAGVQCPTLVPNGVPKILMALYQIDVLDEDFVKNWGTHVSKKYVSKDISKKVRRAAAPFLEWLDQADSESEQDSDDDDDDDDDDDKPPKSKANVNGNGINKTAHNDDNDDDDDSDLDNL